MKLHTLITESSNSPFGVALPLRRPEDIKAAKDVISWVMSRFGESAPFPTILVADHDKMQWAAQRANHFTKIGGQICGWYSQEYPNTVFISSRLSLGRSKPSRAILAHEVVHYLQDATSKHDANKPFGPDMVSTLENEADEIMAAYMSS